MNMELPRSAFKIDYPEEAVLWNHKGKRIDNIPWWRHWWVLCAAVLVLAAASVGVWYWRTQ
ncbi:MAG TPA: hypothetical protein PK468_02405 [Candidatus Hydrogenedentes bacterium]|nr:hypothetical protein [Candidatus Hydrogenedentota bacterium]